MHLDIEMHNKYITISTDNNEMIYNMNINTQQLNIIFDVSS